LVDRIVMNLHPSVLAQAAFLDRPRSRDQLHSTVGLIEEKLSVLKERRQVQSALGASSGSGPRGREISRNKPPTPQSPRCWNCGRSGHIRRDCRQGASSSGNEQLPGGQ
jgi:hypothetical protein